MTNLNSKMNGTWNQLHQLNDTDQIKEKNVKNNYYHSQP